MPSNSAHASRRATSPCALTRQEGFLIEDNGAGFDMHYSEKLFNAFNRLHGDKDFKGSGIGLATVARVVHPLSPWQHLGSRVR